MNRQLPTNATHHGHDGEVVRLSVGSWVQIGVAIIAAVAVLLGGAWHFSTTLEHRMTRVETRVEQIWHLFRPTDDTLTNR